MSAQYTYVQSDSMSRLLDQVNEFCEKYPEYRLLQVFTDSAGHVTIAYAILTTDK